MDLLKNQEELLKNKLEDAATVSERRQIRGDLREIRRKMQEFDLNADENANTVPAKENMNTILPKRDLNSNITKTVSPLETDLKIQAKNSINEAKTTSTDTKSAVSKKSEKEYKINDDSVDLKVKSADERANRRAKRQERMARLAKEQTEEEQKETTVHTDKSLSSIETTTPKDAKNEVKESQNSSSRYDAKRSDVKDTKFSSRSQPTEKSVELKKTESNDDKKSSYSKPLRFDKKDTEKSVELKKTESNDDKKSSYSKPLRFDKKEESVTTTPVDTPKSFVKSTERKEERIFVQGGQKFGGVRQTIEEKTVTENGEKTTYTSRTNSRLSNSLDKFGGAAGRNQLNGSQGDKQKAAKSIGNALNVGLIRDRFASAEKKAPTKAVDLGLNFAKKIDQPGYTVKKYKEVKVEQRSTTSKPLEFGLSFGRDKGQQQTDTKSNLRETSTGSGYKKTTPAPHPRHQTAPAASGGFGMPGGGAKASSVADRMNFFKQAQEQEKADAEKQKQKQEQRARLSSAPASTTSQSTTENRTAPCLKKRDVKKPVRRTMSISSIVLDWCKEMVKDYGVTINNFSGSWSSGLAFCALIHKFNPDKFDYKTLDVNDRHRNFTLAFDTAFEVKKIPKLLDVEDMVRMAKPEPRSVQCYVQWIWSVYGPTSGYGPSQDEIKKAAIG